MHYSWLDLERIIQPFNFQELFVVATLWPKFGDFSGWPDHM